MAQSDIYGPKADRLTRLAVIERSEKDIASRRETPAPPLLRLALGAIGGIFLCMGQSAAIWSWLGAASVMLAVCGAGGRIGAVAGTLAAGIACLRVFDCYNAKAVFWLILFLHAAGGALAGALASLISRRLPAQAFAFLAALLPAGLEHLSSFGAYGHLTSTALTQYGHPAIVCIARLGGLAAVTYVIFLFGAAVAVGVRYARSTTLVFSSTVPAVAGVLLALIFGAISSARTDTLVQVAAFNLNSRGAERQKLFASESYDATAWDGLAQEFFAQAGRVAGRKVAATAIQRDDTAKAVQLLVWPETAVAVDSNTRPKFLKQAEVTARNYKCAVAVAFYDTSTTESVAALTGSGYSTATEYVRRRFASGMDDEIFRHQIVKPGLDAPQTVDTPFGKAGVILSLDANDFRNFAAIAGGGGKIVCVCGLDDKAVPQTSIPLLVFNAALSGLSVVRSVHNGRLAAINPDGKIIAVEATMEKMNTQMMVSLPLGAGSTLFLAVGNGFAWLALLVGVGAGLYASSLPPGSEEPGGAKQPRMTSALSYKTKEGIKEV